MNQTDDLLLNASEALKQALAGDVAGREREWADGIGAALARV